MTPLQDFFDPGILAQAAFAVVVTFTFAGALIAVLPRNILYSVLGLILCLTGVGGIFLYLGSPFIALMELLIYVGAICISIVFAIMLSYPLHLSLTKRQLPKVAGAFGVALLVFGVLISIISRTPWRPAPSAERRLVGEHSRGVSAHALRHGLRGHVHRAAGGHHGGHPHFRYQRQEVVMNSLTTYLFIAAALFVIGVFGLLQRRSLIGMLIAIELMLNGASVNFMAFNRFWRRTPSSVRFTPFS